MADGTWLSAPIDELGSRPGTVLHQKKLVVDGREVTIKQLGCDGQEATLGHGVIDESGRTLQITDTNGESNGFGEPGSEVAVRTATGRKDFSASVHGYGFSPASKRTSALLAQSCTDREQARPILEQKFEAHLAATGYEVGFLCWKFTSPGRAGVPDRVVVAPAGTVFIETKRPGGRLRRLQQKVTEKMRRAGAEIHVVDTVAGVDELVDRLAARRKAA